MKSLALVTENRFLSGEQAQAANVPKPYFANILLEDTLLGEALIKRGIKTERVSWQDASIRWARFDAALFRTTWNYFHHFASFQAWLTRAEKEVRLFNPPTLVRWNWDKHYLAELESKGVNVVQSHYLEPGSSIDLAEELAARPDRELIIKPCISGGARHTYRMTTDNLRSLQDAVRDLQESEAFMVQDVQRSVLSRGEVSLLLFDGMFTHAVRKIPKHGEFRVQDDFGGTVVRYEPTEDELKLAKTAVEALPSSAVYARIDVVQDNDGLPALMEAELIEPELFLRREPRAATTFAASLARHMAPP